MARQRKIGALTWLYLAVSFVLITLGISLFASLADEVIEGETLAFDEAVLRWFEQLHSPFLDTSVTVATSFGGVLAIVVLTVVFASAFWLKKRRRAALQLTISVLGVAMLNLVLKSLFSRSRPELWEQVVLETSYSFPSGHAMASSALALTMVLLLWQTRWRWWVVAIVSLYVVIIGLSRLYLGVHYPSDIVAGWTISAVWVATSAVLVGAIGVRRTPSDQ